MSEALKHVLIDPVVAFGLEPWSPISITDADPHGPRAADAAGAGTKVGVVVSVHIHPDGLAIARVLVEE